MKGSDKEVEEGEKEENRDREGDRARTREGGRGGEGTACFISSFT